jgi:hypothetical protein
MRIDRTAIVACVFTVAALMPTVARAQSSAGPNSRWLIAVDFAVPTGSHPTEHYQGTFTAFSGAPTPVTTSSTYSTTASVGDFAAGVRYRAWHQLGIFLGVTRLSYDRAVDLTATVPHPLGAVAPATDAWSTSDGLSRSVTTFDLAARYEIPIGDRVTINFTGGPSYVRANQSMLSQIHYSHVWNVSGSIHAFNLDDPTPGFFQDTTSSAWGWMFAGEFVYFLHPRFGVAGQYRTGGATLSLTEPMTQTSVSVDLKTTAFAVGGRIRF